MHANYFGCPKGFFLQNALTVSVACDLQVEAELKNTTYKE